MANDEEGARSTASATAGERVNTICTAFCMACVLALYMIRYE